MPQPGRATDVRDVLAGWDVDADESTDGGARTFRVWPVTAVAVAAMLVLVAARRRVR